jgi:DNA-binding HxlR family transcriptional regulator
VKLNENEIIVSTRNIYKTLDMIGGKWKIKICWNLYSETTRFNDLKNKLGTISQKVLTEQLRALENDGIIKRNVLPTNPPQVEYSVTEFGLTLKSVMEELCHWGGSVLDRE